MDIDTLTIIKLEEKQVEQDTKKSKNYIFGMTNEKRKQEEWNKLFPTLAIKGLTEEQLSEVENNVY